MRGKHLRQVGAMKRKLASEFGEENLLEYNASDCPDNIYDFYLKNDNTFSYVQDMINFVKHCFEMNDYTSDIIKKDLFIDNLEYLNLSKECINNIKEELSVKKK